MGLEFTTSDLSKFYAKITPNLTDSTINWRVYKLVQKGIIKRLGKGKFKLGEELLFSSAISKQQIKLNELIKSQFPFIDYCIWNSGWLNEFTHHISKSNTTIIDIERDSAESVYYTIKDEFGSVFYKPELKSLEEYIYQLENCIIVRPLITESPLIHNEIPTTTIEKMLVDAFSDKEFYYLRGAEINSIFENAISKYTVNQSKLLRYASRKGKRSEIEELINSL